jgi:tetratricopeptide (TPR) repeat protein
VTLPRLSGPGPWLAWVAVSLVALPAALQGIHARDTDMFYHLAAGRLMAEQGAILGHEAFSFTRAGAPWTNYYWLFEYLTFRLYAVGGLPALIALRAVLVLLTANLLYYWCRRRSGSPWVALAVSLLAVGLYSARVPNIRPHLVSYLALVLALILLDRMWVRPGRLEPWLPLLAIPWASLHGVEYPVLLLIVGVHVVAALLPHWHTPLGQLARDFDVMRWPALLVLCVLGLALNPFGVGVLETPGIGLVAENMRYIQEMQPYPWPSLFNLFPEPGLWSGVFFHYLVALALVALPDWIRRRDARAILLVSAAAALALHRARFIPEFAILSAGFISEGIAGLVRSASPRGRRLGAALAVGLIGFVLLSAAVTTRAGVVQGHYRLLSETAYPVGPARWLGLSGRGGNVFAEATVAGYLEWTLAPRVRVFMDMRTPDPFDPQIYWMYRDVAFGRDPGRLATLARRWPIDFVLLYREAALGEALLRQPAAGFRLVYADHAFVLFARDGLVAGGPGPALEELNPFDGSLDYVQALAEPERRERLRRECARLLQVWPENHLAHQTELAVLLRSGQPDPALAKARRLLEAFPREPRYPYAAGLALLALGQDAAALPHLERAVALDPAFGPAYPAAAEASLRTGRAERGRALMEEYLLRRRHRLTADEYALLGALRSGADRWREALQAYERALWLVGDPDPRRARLENDLGRVYLALEEPGTALGHLEVALALEPALAEAQLNRARAWLRLGRTHEAVAALRRLAEDGSAPHAVRAAARARLQALPGS